MEVSAFFKNCVDLFSLTHLESFAILSIVPIQRIMSQSLDSLQVLAGPGSTPGIGDIVVTTRSGYTTTLAKSFAYEATSGLFHSDFESRWGGRLCATATRFPAARRLRQGPR